MKYKLSFVAAIGIAFTIILAGPLWYRRSTLPLTGNSTSDRTVILQRIPIGMNISSAKSYMEQRGCSCTYHPKGRYDSMGDGAKKDILYCYRYGWNNRSWTIGIEHNRRKVTDVVVRFSQRAWNLDF